MAEPQNDRAEDIGKRETQPGVQGAHGRKDDPRPPVDAGDDIVRKGGQIAQDDQQSSGLGSGQA